MQFIQCDDLVEPTVADEIERLMTSRGFPWFFYANVNNTLRPEERQAHPTVICDDPRFEESFGFSHLIFPTGEPGTPSPWMHYPKHLFEAFLNRHRLLPTKLLRVKANLLVRSPAPSGPRPFAPHVDLPTPHWVMIYYVNDSDGDTLILDKTYPDRENAAVLHAVSPKKGRAILFDGRHYHCGTCPSRHDARIVFNYDFV
jgi:hypothetical protein